MVLWHFGRVSIWVRFPEAALNLRFIMQEAFSKFTPYCYLSEKSDAFTVYFANECDYSEVLSDNITLYRSLETKEIVGCRIDAFSKFCEKFSE